jgi:hypothetical protein
MYDGTGASPPKTYLRQVETAGFGFGRRTHEAAASE